VSPGPVSTALWLGQDGVAATGRFTTPQEVADLMVFLASDRAANITGADFTIDGGLIKTL
jgi:NAD(P)-dependent dehydrogenase (short-subunit alcohol dehydrogenase family)